MIRNPLSISFDFYKVMKPLLKIAVLLLVLITMGGCKSGKKNVKPYSSPRHDIVTIDKHSIKGNKDQKALVEEVMSWIGVPYAYAKSDKKEGTDCSGLVLRVYLDVLDVKLPRNSAQQAEFCKKIDKEDVEPGDLVFFATGKDPDKISHVGMMIDKENFIHASTKKGVLISQLNTPYYIRTFRQAGRVPR